MTDIKLDNIDLEQQVLRENISSAVGLDPSLIQIGIKGGPSLRETAMDRCRYESETDRIFDKVEPVFEDMLLRRGTFQLFVGFNNGEIRTRSIFDPLREEIHDVSHLSSPHYLARHFPTIPYEEKRRVMFDLYENMLHSRLSDYLPSHLKSLAIKRHNDWQPMPKQDVEKVLQHLKLMRNLPEYYLRNFSISIVQSVVRLQFNCDGTQIIHAKDFDSFMQQNMP